MATGVLCMHDIAGNFPIYIVNMYSCDLNLSSRLKITSGIRAKCTKHECLARHLQNARDCSIRVIVLEQREFNNELTNFNVQFYLYLSCPNTQPFQPPAGYQPPASILNSNACNMEFLLQNQ